MRHPCSILSGFLLTLASGCQNYPPDTVLADRKNEAIFVIDDGKGYFGLGNKESAAQIVKTSGSKIEVDEKGCFSVGQLPLYIGESSAVTCFEGYKISQEEIDGLYKVLCLTDSKALLCENFSPEEAILKYVYRKGQFQELVIAPDAPDKIELSV